MNGASAGAAFAVSVLVCAAATAQTPATDSSMQLLRELQAQQAVLAQRIADLEAALETARAANTKPPTGPAVSGQRDDASGDAMRSRGIAAPVQVASATPATLPPASAEPHGASFAVSVEGNYLKPRGGNFVLGDITAAQTGNPTFGSSTSFGQQVAVDYDAAPGARFVAGFRPQGSVLGVGMAYSYLRASGGSEAQNIRPELGNTSNLAFAPETASYATAQGRMDLRYDVADLFATAALDVGTPIAVTLNGGFRYARLDQDRELAYQNGQSTLSNIYQVSTSSKHSNKLDAAGIHLGADASYALGHGFRMTGSLGGSLLYGRYDVFDSTSVTERFLFSPNAFTTNGTNAERTATEHRLVPAIDAALGFSWEHRLSSTGSIEAAAGYRFENWFNVARSNTVGAATLSDLGFDGPYVRVTGRW